MDRIALCRLEDVPDLQPLHVKVEGASPVSVFRTGDEAAVTDARCPHKGAPLARYAEREGETVVCLWHSCRFDLHTGAVLDGPCPDPLKVHACEVEDEVVYLRQLS
jgi:nitrite reductase/ring-hydroxylating ferredoxin subunit